MAFRSSFLPLAALLVALPAAAKPGESPAPQPHFQLVAQAYDRCMVTYAVRLTRTAATDAEILDQASRSCLGLRARLHEAIEAQLPPAEAAELLAAIDAQAAPGFLATLARIRADRARRAGE